MAQKPAKSLILRADHRESGAGIGIAKSITEHSFCLGHFP
jgi:hypothetical protein